MKITELIAQHITELYEGGNWTEVNVKDTLSDVGYREAATETRASSNTIAALVHHLSYYNDLVLQRLQERDPVTNDSNGFDVPAIRNDQDWIQLKEASMRSARALITAVRQFPEEKIFEVTAAGLSTYYKTLHGLIEHAYYHLGQIVLLKKLIWLTKHLPARSSSL